MATDTTGAERRSDGTHGVNDLLPRPLETIGVEQGRPSRICDDGMKPPPRGRASAIIDVPDGEVFPAGRTHDGQMPGL